MSERWDLTPSALLEEAHTARRVGSAIGAAGLAGGVLLGAVAGPVGIALAAAGAAFAAGALVRAGRKEEQARQLELGGVAEVVEEVR